ncbi:30S ribosomal protein S6 [Candidatus Mycoplasma haematominutum]|uniref:Small ribosomal subunit protein bS6 n=1 Tax=Candidatus Mycoplasma haematominutum 'Birmingham 1' TaxID=1116213 RepID=G8C2I5_9MOLU|nr:30S ribosomal protein S6 [Candidatus Mycoplasma haematominutum]CCE66533.1 ribosomal protein S6 [Candidatus Mycoplasma haematominutum 'Birmingham 1']
MFLLDADCSEIESAREIKPLLDLFEGEQDYKMNVSWSDELAYPIKHKRQAHRYLLNFTLFDIEKIAEFRKLSSLNPKILRHLIINVEKSYGYRRSINPKRMAIAEKKFQKYQEFRRRRQRTSERMQFKPPVNPL